MKARLTAANGNRRLIFARNYKGLMVLIPVQKTLNDLFWQLFFTLGVHCHRCSYRLVQIEHKKAPTAQ
jgi:hypothetical protein